MFWFERDYAFLAEFWWLEVAETMAPMVEVHGAHAVVTIGRSFPWRVNGMVLTLIAARKGQDSPGRWQKKAALVGPLLLSLLCQTHGTGNPLLLPAQEHRDTS